MKGFACGDVVPGCDASWVCSTEDEILAQVAGHAVTAHGIADLDDGLVAAVRSQIVSIA